jgi:hypothetical protein
LILIIVFGIGIGVGIYDEEPRPASTPMPYTIQVVNGIANVAAGTYLDYKFNIPSGASNISISGTLTAQGGSGNDIKVYIFGSTDFDNYKNGNDFTALYQSGQVKSTSISANIPSSGTYYLVLDNKFSTTTDKTVNIQATYTYLK